MLTAFFAMALCFFLAAAVVAFVDAADGIERGRWLALHLALVGGVSQLVIGAAQFFSGAFLATDPPSRWVIRGQIVLWNTGTVALAFGVMNASVWIIDLAAAALGAALLLVVVGLRSLQRRSLARAPWAARWYFTCVAFLLAGIVAGVAIARGTPWTHGDLLSAHLALNIGGWLGTAIVGTLHTFYPSLTQTQLRYPRLQGPTWWCWTTGVATLAGGSAFAVPELILAGWSALLVASLLLVANIVACAAEGRVHELAPSLVTIAQPYLPAALLLALVSSAAGPGGAVAGDARATFAVLALFGWVGLTVLGSLLHLLSVVARVRNLSRPAPRVGLHPSLAVMASFFISLLAVARLTGSDGLAHVSVVLLAVTFGLLITRIVMLTMRALRAAPLRL